jgi:DMSO/TMAO reductase YedYZ heme-binding membrane subunit
VVEMEGAIAIGVVAAILCTYHHVSVLFDSPIRTVCLIESISPLRIITVSSIPLHVLLLIACTSVAMTSYICSY